MAITTELGVQTSRILKIQDETSQTVDVTVSLVGVDGTLTEIEGSPISLNKVDDGRYLFRHSFESLGTYSIVYSTLVSDSIVVVDQLATQNSLDDIQESVSHMEQMVYVDTDATSQGDGTFLSPFNTIASALDYVEAHNVDRVVLRSDVSMDREMHDITFYGHGCHSIDTDSGIRDFEGCEIHNCKLTGFMDKILAVDCVLEGANIWGTYLNCGIDGDLSCLSAQYAVLEGCYDVSTNTDAPFNSVSMTGVQDNFKLNVTGYEGSLIIGDSTNPLNHIVVHADGARLVIGGGCNEGTLNLYGGYKLWNVAGGSITVEEEFRSASREDVLDAAPDLSTVEDRLDVLNSGF